VGSHLELGAFGAWVALRKRGLRASGFVAAVLLLLALPAPRSMASIAWIAAGVVVWLVAVEILGAGSSAVAGEGGPDALTAVDDDTRDESPEVAEGEGPTAEPEPADEPSAAEAEADEEPPAAEAVESGEEETSS
jgi:hypothetical protein